MNCKMNSAAKKNSGFTLVEIALAVAILGLGLTTLVSLQTAVINNYLREIKLIKASLYGQYLMTLIEVAPEAPETGTKETALEDELKEAGYFDADDFNEVKEDFADWKVKKEINSVPVPPFEDAMRRVDLTITWGEGERDRLKLTYFRQSLPSGQLGGTE